MSGSVHGSDSPAISHVVSGQTPAEVDTFWTPLFNWFLRVSTGRWPRPSSASRSC
jgi:hypothetical protein